MINNENSFQGFMKKTFEDIAAFDQHTIEKLQSIFTEFANYKVSQYANLTGHLNGIVPVINNIQSAGPFQDFDRRYEITQSEVWNKPRSLDLFAYKISPHNVVKEGALYRTAEIRSSHWKPVWVVLTDTGYLHCFKMPMDKKVIRAHTISKQGSGENILDCGQKTYNDLKKPETYFSLRIGSNIKCVQSKIKKAPKYTFDIIVDNSIKSNDPNDYKVAAEEIKRKKSVFGGSSSSSSKKSVTFSLRADTQEIYDSWVDKILSQSEKSKLSESVATLVNIPPVSPITSTEQNPEEVSDLAAGPTLVERPEPTSEPTSEPTKEAVSEPCDEKANELVSDVVKKVSQPVPIGEMQ